jgi:2-amino-4-hydroxy-6-hydroxymethyldihydropteridine diphosphokinase
MRCYVGLGSNIGDRAAFLKAALELLQSTEHGAQSTEHGARSTEIAVTRVSSAYETEPIGNGDQPDFLNLVAEIETDLRPKDLFERTRNVETQVGAKALFPNGPREIDIDILLCGDYEVHEPDLDIPHPRMRERAFVLVPLAEIAPDLALPDNTPVAEAAERLRKEQRVKKADYRF